MASKSSFGAISAEIASANPAADIHFLQQLATSTNPWGWNARGQGVSESVWRQLDNGFAAKEDGDCHYMTSIKSMVWEISHEIAPHCAKFIVVLVMCFVILYACHLRRFDFVPQAAQAAAQAGLGLKKQGSLCVPSCPGNEACCPLN